MKKLFFAFFIILFSYSINSNAEEVKPTPFKFCFWPGVGIPLRENVDGLNLGLINYGTVHGVDLGIVSLTKEVRGGKIAFVANGKSAGGVELGIINLLRKMSGFQLGIYNRSIDYGNGLQLGFVNRAGNSNALQIGIINIMENGFVRIFPIFNLPDKWFH